MQKTFNELKSLIDYAGQREGIQIKINAVPVEVMTRIANYYGLHVFTPEEHAMDFTFVKGYFDTNGNVKVSKSGSVGCFSLTDFEELVELLEHHEG